MFLIFLTKENQEKFVSELCDKLGITNQEHIDKINQYYDMFLELKNNNFMTAD